MPISDRQPSGLLLMVVAVNCHNQATAKGLWAEKRLLLYNRWYTAADTASFYFYDAGTGALRRYCQVINKTKLNPIWGDYKDSVKRYYADTIANASYRILKTFAGTPWGFLQQGVH